MTVTLRSEKFGLSRRRFLQAALATGSATAIDPRLVFGTRANAAPLGPNDRIVVVVELAGGNDGLNTVIPYENGRYVDLRSPGKLVIPGAQVHPVGEGLGLHPNLVYLKSRFDAGELAIVRGFGSPANDRSHFSMSEQLARGSADAGVTGWAGRWLDQLPDNELAGVSITEGSPPLILRGSHAPCTNLPSSSGGLFGSDRIDPNDKLLYERLSAMSLETTGFGEFGPSIGLATAEALNVAADMNPVYSTAAPHGGFARSMYVVAALINLDIGARFVHTRLDGFDSHSNQLGPHAKLLAEIDEGIRVFFETLDPAKRERVLVMTTSEFGRRAAANASEGTDHGGASAQFVIGSLVRGGLHGEQPPLDALDERGDLRVSVDCRSVFATVVGAWLGGDDHAVFGASHAKLDLFRSTPPAVGPVVVRDLSLFQAVTPFRILDTRVGNGAAAQKWANRAVAVQIAGRGTVPSAGVGAVVLNLTVTDPDNPGFLTVWPGPTMPDASHVNFGAGSTVPNLAVVKLDSDGALNFGVLGGPTHAIADVMGWIPASHPYTPVVPTRILDSRRHLGAAGPLLASHPIRVPVTGIAGVPSSGVAAVVLNLTATESTDPTFVNAWPAGEPEPNTSVLNVADSRPVANLVILGPGADGALDLSTAAGSTHIIADIQGWFPASTGYHTVSPRRILDTRSGLGANGVVGHQSSIDVAIPTVVPDTAGAVVINITVVDPQVGGFVTVWPAGLPRPNTSNLNFLAGQVVANLVVCGVGVNRSVSLHNAYGTVHLVADLVGWFD